MGDLDGQLSVLGRVNLVQPIGQHGDRPAAALECAMMGRGIDPACQARDNREPGPRQGRGQALGDAHPVRSAPPRADERDGELVALLERPLGIEQWRWVGYFQEWRRIALITPRNELDSGTAAELDLGPHIHVLPRSLDLLGNLRPHTRNVAQLGQRSVENSAGRLEPLEKCPAGVRPHARHHRQEDQVAQLGLRGSLIHTELQFVAKGTPVAFTAVAFLSSLTLRASVFLTSLTLRVSIQPPPATRQPPAATRHPSLATRHPPSVTRHPSLFRRCAEGRQHRAHVVGSGCVGQLNLPQRPRQNESDLAAAVLLVAAHGLEQAIRI